LDDLGYYPHFRKPPINVWPQQKIATWRRRASRRARGHRAAVRHCGGVPDGGRQGKAQGPGSTTGAGGDEGVGTGHLMQGYDGYTYK
jgi:hypothetical protein